jgi:hypothetical protein
MKFFTTTAIVLAATGAATLAVPAAAQDYSFTRDGVEYRVRETAAKGVRIIEGRDSAGGTFFYRVRGNRVSGVHNGQTVSFDARNQAPQKIATR